MEASQANVILLWIVQILSGIVLALALLILRRLWTQFDEHTRKFEDVIRTMMPRAEVDAKFERLQTDREKMHGENQGLMNEIKLMVREIDDRQRDNPALEARVTVLDRLLTEVRDWKHKIGEAYLPAAVDNLKEQADRIEDRLMTFERAKGKRG